MSTEMVTNYLLLSMKDMRDITKSRLKKLTRSSLCHLYGCDPQGPDITLQNTQEIVSVSVFYTISLSHTHTKQSMTVTL